MRIYLSYHLPGIRSVLLLTMMLAMLSLVLVAAEPPSSKEKLETIKQVLQSPSSSPVTDILDDERLWLICIAGAMIGSVASLCLFLPATVQEMARKLFVSAGVSVLFTPWLMGWLNLPFRTSNVLASAGAVALISWSVMQAVVPSVSAWVIKWFSSKTGSN